MFRPATAFDLPALLELQETFYRSEGYPFFSGVAARAMEQLAGDARAGRLFVIEWRGEVVGYLAVTFGFSLEFGGRDAFVDELYIAPAARGQGLGKQALAVAEEACREAGIGALHLEVEHGNEPALALYTRSGFVEHTRHLMTRRLSS